LTGRPPFLAATPYDTIRQVVSDDPVPVRNLQPRTPRDLETICHRCLEKEPVRRYQSAAELADELDRYLRGEPVLARPGGSLERAVKWVSRRPTLAALIAVSVLALVGGTAVSTYFALEAQQKATFAQEKEGEARKKEGEAKEALAEVEEALARGLFRPLGHH